MTAVVGARVSVHGVAVGDLFRLDDDENHEFRFDDAWLADPQRPVLGQLFEDRRPMPIATSGLPNWFAHVLPQGPWARHIRAWTGLDEGASDLELLLAVASDLPGALGLQPVGGGPLSAAVARRPKPPPGNIAFTLAGAQWKLSVREGERGLVVPVAGEEGDLIAKFADPQFESLPRLENATLAWAREAGLDAVAASLDRVERFERLPAGLPTGEGEVLLVRRFDRSAAGPVHFEELAQVADRIPGSGLGGQYHGSYEELATLIRALCPSDAGKFFDRLVFTVLSGDGDAHWKNWAVVYPDRRTARLAPAYDLVPTIVFPRLEPGLALRLNGRTRFDQIDARSFAAIGRKLGWSDALLEQRLEDAVARVRAAFGRAKALYPPDAAAAIEHHLERTLNS